MVKKILGRSYIWLILLIMYAPIIVLIVFSFSTSDILKFNNGFSLNLYKVLFLDSSGFDGLGMSKGQIANQMNNVKKLWVAIGNTFSIAFTSAIVSTIIGTFGAIGVYFAKKKLKGTVKVLEQIQVATPEIVIGISLTLLFVLSRVIFGQFEFSYFTLLIGHVVLTLPFVVLSIVPKLKQMDPNLYEAALDLGAHPFTAFRKVMVPELLPGILSGFLLSVTLSLDDYIITDFTRNNSFETLSTYLEAIVSKSGIPPYIRAFTTFLFFICICVTIVIGLYQKKQKKGEIKND
jgi:spermidine/putrescine transport system permease protein